MEKHMIFLGVLSMIVGVASQLPPRPVVFIPTLYVTSEPEAPKPRQAVTYSATVCNTKVYAPYMVIARVNMPNGWRPFIGVVAKIEMCSSASCSEVLCSNFENGVFNGQHNCSMPYNTTYTQLFIRATAGNAPNMAWTVAIEFVPKSGYVGNRYVKWFDVEEPKARNIIKANDVKILQQVVTPTSKQQVSTLDRRDFSMAFCPDGATTQRYNIEVIVSALNSRSAMASYACVPPFVGDKCDPATAIASDPRGIGINVVTLQTGSGSLKDIYVIVVGWGDGEQINNFELSAVVTRK